LFEHGAFVRNSTLYIGNPQSDQPAGCPQEPQCYLCNYGLLGRYSWPTLLYVNTTGRVGIGEPEFVNVPVQLQPLASFPFCVWDLIFPPFTDPLFPSYTWLFGVTWDDFLGGWSGGAQWNGLLDGAVLNPVPNVVQADTVNPLMLTFRFHGRISPSVGIDGDLPMYITFSELPL